MIKSRYNWDFSQPTESITEDIVKKLNLSPIIKKVLESKDIVQEEAIQNVIQDNVINHNPMSLSDMHKAIERINLAIDKK